MEDVLGKAKKGDPGKEVEKISVHKYSDVIRRYSGSMKCPRTIEVQMLDDKIERALQTIEAIANEQAFT